ncbi:MAG: methionine synthase, partial [Bacteroidales bacterium]|nr:methionine synthase [Bacteroidales bacterium]
MKNFEELIRQKILILDGAMGTMIQSYGLQEEDYRGVILKDHTKELKGNNDLLSITKPEIIINIHKAYLEAGANIIETNTFNANKISQADYGTADKVYEMNVQAAQNARKTIDDYEKISGTSEHFIAGSIGPTNRSASMSANVNDPGARAVTFDNLVEAFEEQVNGLIDGGVDILLVETVSDPINCKAALYAIYKILDDRKISMPVMVSATLADTNGRLLTGQSLEAFVTAISHFPITSIGMNCAFGAAQLRPFVEELSGMTSCFVSVHPNAGLPNEFGEYEQKAEDMASVVEDYMKNGWVNIVGGCCGTTPQHIKAIAEKAKKYKPRISPTLARNTKLCGLETLTITPNNNFVNIGERTNVAGSAKFSRLIKEEKYDEAIAIARHQVETGAQIIDVCMDAALLDSEKSMVRFLNLIMSEPEIAKVPIMIDSSNWDVILAGLKCVEGKSIVNSISLKEGEEAFLKKAQTIRQYGAAIVVMLFDENGQADTFERKISVAKRSYDLLVNSLNFPPEDIIFDPNVLAIATGIAEHDNYAVNFIKATEWIKKNLPYAKISGGISNLSFSFRGINKVREAMHSVFLYHAINAGLDMGLVNPGMLQVYSDIDPVLLELTEDVVLNRRPDATERLIKLAETLKDDKQQESKTDQWRTQPVIDRIKYAVIRGIDEFISADVEEARPMFPKAINIIEGPLMDGINEVGRLFGDGQMFLPQVVKSARVMKKAVESLTKYIEEENAESNNTKTGKVLLATVKGDVHDIGKNILNVVLSCNNYEILDLGVMVPCEKILATAKKENVDFIGLSGLITPSLKEMEHVAIEMEKEKLSLPLLIGGATTSEIYAAVKLSPLYSGPVVYAKDASQVAGILASIKSSKEEYVAKTNKRYEELRNIHNSSSTNRELLTIEEARANKLKINWKAYKIRKPINIGRYILRNVNIRDLEEYIDWTNYFIGWGIKGKYPNVFNDKKYGEEARKLFDDTLVFLEKAINNNLYSTAAVFGNFPA